jgi:hypothetical protein
MAISRHARWMRRGFRRDWRSTFVEQLSGGFGCHAGRGTVANDVVARFAVKQSGVGSADVSR